MHYQRLCWLPLLFMCQRLWATQLAGIHDRDELACVDDNTPVCGRLGAEYLVFANECDRLKARRAKLLDELLDVPLHYCMPKCDFTCTPQSKPICGVSMTTGEQKTFNNMCELKLMSCYTKSEWSVTQSGKCPGHKLQSTKDNTRAKQPLPCTNVFRPVCATFAAVKSTFPNECLLNAENIKRGQSWQIVSEGFCEEDKNRLGYRKYLATLERNKANAERKRQRKHEGERGKRSTEQDYNFDDLQLGAETVFIYAPSAFHTHFISNHGTFEKHYTEVDNTFAADETTSRVAVPTIATTTTTTTPMPINNYERQTMAYDVNRIDNNEYKAEVHHCEYFCDSYFEPLCVSRNGVNYTMINECFLRSAKCRDPKSVWQVIDERECSTPSPPHVLKDRYITERPGFRYTSDYVGSTFFEQKPRREMFGNEPETKTFEIPTTKNVPVVEPTTTNAPIVPIIEPTTTNAPIVPIIEPTTTNSPIVPIIEPTTTIASTMNANVATESTTTTTTSKPTSQIVPSTKSTTIMSFTTTTAKPKTTNSWLTPSFFKITKSKPYSRTNLTARNYSSPTRKSLRKSSGSRSQSRRTQTKHKPRRLSSKHSSSLRSRSRSKSGRKPKTTTTTTTTTTMKPIENTTNREARLTSLTTIEPPTMATTATTKFDFGSNESFLRDYLRKEQESNRSLLKRLDKGINWKNSEYTSIYGTDSNSLMMRLLRAKFV